MKECNTHVSKIALALKFL